ncbi:RpiR family transcriptional regulator [Lactobacillus pasteurii DSM 23907 = CRBIP 24.76]|uniref:Transcriptional regulator n=1 Tax=Lactobacillus pasteurii DSM 23907 = CRBIP 24.76 TaxID=1423790 RepID=I7IYS8_9LACO|nr:MurR/RpiR family transcriptional regulator [Lactobacillus pasteurii]KRK07689.1 RpiR family transcriptional regulator [Lactobacillus pasteurii DSM 23907 = CRBIP 24.76]TDG77698.1 hypothetical protein C5L33_000109 [Lactobacillus pasteurii]CCI84697.1 Transcriptional regulator [Lactobacillus pasteurii DSM 23907 = CRBIP 24.76]
MAFFGYKDLSSLSEVDLTIYRYVVDNSEKVVYMRVRDIAQNAHVSSSSVMRFIHKMNFSSFLEFKAYIKNANAGHDPNHQLKFIDDNNFPKDINNSLQVVADIIYDSDNIITVGMGDSAFLAEYAARKMASLEFNTTAVSDPFYPLKAKLKNTTDTALICFSVSGNTTEIIELLNSFVNNEDVTIISVTSDETSAIAKISQHILNYHIKQRRLPNQYDMTSQIPAMYIIEELVNILAGMTN